METANQTAVCPCPAGYWPSRCGKKNREESCLPDGVVSYEASADKPFFVLLFLIHKALYFDFRWLHKVINV